MSPKVTVLMSVYNGEPFLRESLESILNQSFSNFEFLIIDDASTDSSREIIDSYFDSRIRLIENSDNIGLARSLNKGIELSSGEYIARMDADDISLPQRLEEQVDFMNRNVDVGVCGTMVQLIDSNGKVLHLGYDEKIMWKDEDMKAQLLFKPCFLHPTVMYRSEILKSNGIIYGEMNGRYSQDYHLWYELSSICAFANITRIYLKYRIHERQSSKQKRKYQNISSSHIKNIILEEFLGRNLSSEDQIKHARISFFQHVSNMTEIDEAENWLKLLMHCNEMNRKYRRDSLTKVLQNIWILLCMNSSHLGMRLLKKYLSSVFWKFKIENIYQEMKLVFKCLIKYNVKLLAYDRTFQNQDLGLFE
tara:strand:+ start:507 stop:1595 length:1089 start_codon:yes stop_codon:yes gene_type:complete